MGLFKRKPKDPTKAPWKPGVDARRIKDGPYAGYIQVRPGALTSHHKLLMLFSRTRIRHWLN